MLKKSPCKHKYQGIKGFKKQKTICMYSCRQLQEPYFDGSCKASLTDVVRGLCSNLMHPKGTVSKMILSLANSLMESVAIPHSEEIYFN